MHIDRKKLDKKELRKFGITGTIFFAAIATLQLLLGKEIYLYFYILSLGFSIGIFFPPLLKPVYIVLVTVGSVVGRVVTYLILTLLFYGIVTPIGVLGRILGKHFLDLQKRNKKSYWIAVNKTPSKTEFENQF